MADGGLERSLCIRNDRCEYTESCLCNGGGKLGPNDEDGLMLLKVDGGRELRLQAGEIASSDNPDGVFIRENGLWSTSSGSTGTTDSIGDCSRELDRLNGLNLERHDEVCSTGSTGDEDFQRRNFIFLEYLISHENGQGKLHLWRTVMTLFTIYLTTRRRVPK